jgi:hypothetical protein
LITFWKRNANGIIAPFKAIDPIDFYVVNVKPKKALGQFVFPKARLIEKVMISTPTKDDKKAFCIYPKWDILKFEQTERTKRW